jgi:esterase FrsA
MNEIDEFKQFASLHARAQNIRGSENILGRINHDGDEPGSWAWEWSHRAEEFRARGRLLDAVSHYNMARFPFVDGPARQQALDRSISTFALWAEKNGVERLTLPILGEKVDCWAAGLSSGDPRPLVLLCGGIVSSKEQWAPALSALRKLGFAGVVAEMPGVGENPLPYNADSWRMFPAILDAVEDRSQVSETYAMALSFSGHLALRSAAEDSRFRGVVTAGPPVRDFFLDANWLARLPGITIRTLERLTGLSAAALPAALAVWAIPLDQLAALDIPVACTASKRDEIIPSGDVAALRDNVEHLWLAENDDVHGSPHHVAQTRLWAMHSILRMRGGPTLPRLILGGGLSLLRARRGLTGGRST